MLEVRQAEASERSQPPPTTDAATIVNFPSIRERGKKTWGERDLWQFQKVTSLRHVGPSP